MKKMEAQPIPEADLATILSLHLHRLGWSYLLDNTVADRATGFPCEDEEFAIRRELRKAVQKVSEWFRTMGRKNDWPSREGWMWEIDFESGQVVPKKQRLQAHEVESGQDNDSQCDLLVESSIMTLGDMDLDIIRRLLEKRDALADSVRSNLRRCLRGDFSMEKLNTMVQQLGAADKDVRDWFSEMADKYQWPKAKDNRWLYRVDVSEKQVYLVRR